MAATDFWASLLETLRAPDVCRFMISQLATDAELRRVDADYDTGSIAEDEALSLLALAEWLNASVVIEVGTFIGLSTTALAAAPSVGSVYTCDVSNDCLTRTNKIHTYPKQTSTQMLRDLITRGVRADLCFFDGALCELDVELLMPLTHDRTVFTVHDYTYGPKIRTRHGQTWHETVPRKGVGNIRLLQPRLQKHVLIDPMPGTLVAALVPESIL